MHLLALVAGALLVGATLWDAFETLVLPRTPRRRLRFTRLFYRTTWWAWSAASLRMASPPKRERFLAVFGPLSVFALLAVWAAALVVGFALLQWSQRELLLNVAGVAHLSDDLYMSATTLFALGLGDVAPKGHVGRLLIVAETGSSLVLLSMLFSYIPIVYQSFARRELRVTMLDARAGCPPTASEILCRLARRRDPSSFDRFFAEWEHWCADLLESHLSYPAIAYFRSLHHRQSWIAALAALLDATALVKVGIDGIPVGQAHLAFAMARHAAVDLAHVAGQPSPFEDRFAATELEAIRAELEGAGLCPNRSTDADLALVKLRRSYEPYIAALSSRLLMPRPPWRPTHAVRDNWETDPQGDGGPHF